MSGAEIYQVFASTITVMELARWMIQFLKNAAHADSHVRELRGKIRQLHRIVETVQALVEHRQNMQKGEVVNSCERKIWKDLKMSLRASKTLLKGFEDTVKSKDCPNPGLIRRGIIEIRLELNRNEIGAFEQGLNTQVQAIQVWISSLQV